MTEALVTYILNGDVAWVTLNDPSSLNALSVRMVDELALALQRASANARAIVLTGAGRGFCSGANLREDLDPNVPDYDAGAGLDRYYNPLMLALRNLPVPLITAVNGAAAGIGAAMAMAGDMIVASEQAFFMLAFSRIGLVPDGGSAFLLVHAVGRARAMELMLLGERLPAARALDWGLIHRVVPGERLNETAGALAETLARGPTKALAGIRRLCWQAAEMGYAQGLAEERLMQREAGRTADHREGVAAFLQKRDARFAGV